MFYYDVELFLVVASLVSAAMGNKLEWRETMNAVQLLRQQRSTVKPTTQRQDLGPE
jgi:hypothetical protein